jgi:hypothetical protein
MIAVLLLSAFAGVSAFAPASQSSTRVASVLNAADLSSMRGVGPETGGKVVSCFLRASPPSQRPELPMTRSFSNRDFCLVNRDEK